MRDTDKQVRALFDLVQKRKKAIAKMEKPSWKTNCAFSYNPGSVDANVNIATVRTVDNVVMMASFLIAKKESYDKAQEALGTSEKFKWCGYKFEDWLDDFRSRVDKISIAKKRKELEGLERRLDTVLSPELKAQMEVEAISKELEE